MITCTIHDDLTGEVYPLAHTEYPWLSMFPPVFSRAYEVVRFPDPHVFTCPHCQTPRTINRRRDLAYGGVTYCATCKHLWMLTGCFGSANLVYTPVPKTAYIAAFAGFCQRQLAIAALALPAPKEA